MATAPDPRDRSSTVPLQSTGALDDYQHANLTPVIGLEFRNVALSDLVDAPNCDALLRELAVQVSQRGVVFFRDQAEPLSPEHQKKNRIIHQTEAWSISFEPVPSDFAILNMTQIPENGGDTVWASSYEVYDRLTPEFAKFLEGLTATHDGSEFHARARDLGVPLYEGTRGHPANVGTTFIASHPVIRTNPVTGYKGIFVNKNFTKRINELNLDESKVVLDFLFKLVTENHDLQVRYKWENIFAVTVDYEGMLVRKGNRAVSLGERPFFDPNSVSRREALGLPKWE
ncbi:hypothetical protein RQP46_010036 [Phenoliferia psychrophenolica]